MYSQKLSIISLLVIVTLILSTVSVLITASPANAAVSTITINYPASDNITLVKPGSNVMVGYTLNGTTGLISNINFQIWSATLGTVFNQTFSLAENVTSQQTTTVNVTATQGLYNLLITNADNPAVTASKTGCIYVDTTAPSVSISLPNSSSCWKGGTANNIQWAASDAASTDNVTVYAALSTDSGATYAYSILNGVSYAQGAQVYSYSAPAVTSSTCKMVMWATDRAGNTCDNVTSSLFSILNTAPTPTVTAPNGGEDWNGGSSQTITGTITGTVATVYYLLSLSTDGGATWSENITSSWQTATLTGGVYNLSYLWTVSSNVCSNSCRIRLYAKDCANNMAFDISNANFTIRDVTPPTVTVTRPTTGQTLYCGTAENITWTQTDNRLGNLSYTVYYTLDGGATPYLLIGSGTSAQGSAFITWTIPTGTSSTNCKIKIVVCDSCLGTNYCTTAYSNTFTVTCDSTPPTITLCTPNGGETWQVGSTQSITWTCSDNDATARMTYLIQLSTDSGVTWTVAPPNPIATLSNQIQCSSCGCSYSWAVSDNASTTAMIKITATDPANNSASDTSNAVFTITANPCAVQTSTVTLYPGWNLMSLPLIPSTTNIDTVLSSVMPYVVSVWYYSGGASGSWLSYAPGAPSTLTSMYDGKAYWIYMSNTAPTYTLSFQGRKSQCPPNPLSPTYTMSTLGWNMVGFKSTINKTVSNYMTSMGTCGTAYLAPVSGWNAQTGSALSPNCSDNMTPGNGYWVYIQTAGTIVPGTD